MDIYQKISNSLEPLGGDLLLDAFADARRAALARSQKVAAVASRAPEERPSTTSMASNSDRAAATISAPPSVEPPDPQALDDTGKLRLEIQEFLRERSGFDPTQIE